MKLPLNPAPPLPPLGRGRGGRGGADHDADVFTKPKGFGLNPKGLKEKVMGKMYKGNIPDSSEGWDEIDILMDKDRVEWIVFCKKQDHDQNWWNIKIVANGRAQSKANYWLALNIKTGQLGFAMDYIFMRENRPDLHAQVETIFKKAIKQ